MSVLIRKKPPGFYDLKAKKYIIKKAKANLPKIHVRPGIQLQYKRCHINSVGMAIINRHESIAICLAYNPSEMYPFVHFINVDNSGVFVDNTLGKESIKKNYQYFLLKYIPKDQYCEVDDLLEKWQDIVKYYLPKEWRNKVTLTF